MTVNTFIQNQFYNLNKINEILYVHGNRNHIHKEFEEFNSCDSSRATVIAEALFSAGEKILRDNVHTPGQDNDILRLLQSWEKKLHKKISAISSPTFWFKWKDNIVIEKRGVLTSIPGKEHGIQGELREYLAGAGNHNGFIDWKKILPEERISIFSLLLLAGSGSALEEVNHIKDLKYIAYWLARKMAVMEKNTGRVFNLDSIVLLKEIDALKDTEERMMKDRDLERIVLVEDKRKVLYSKKYEPDWCCVKRIAGKLNINKDYFIPSSIQYDELKKISDKRQLKNVFGTLLQLIRDDLADDVVIIYSMGKKGYVKGGKLSPGDYYIAQGAFLDGIYYYKAKVFISDGHYKVSGKKEGPPKKIMEDKYDRNIRNQAWRRNETDLIHSNSSTHFMRKQVLSWTLNGSNMVQKIIEKKVTTTLFQRLVDINITKKIAGLQEETNELQLGYHLSFYEDGTYINPAHAKGGIQNMMRIPTILGTDRDIRLIREGVREEACFRIHDIYTLKSYAHVINAFLKANMEC